jgi:hypothetical protein
LEDFVASVGRYEGRGPVPQALLHGRHPLHRAPALRVGYLPWSNALGTWPLPLPKSGHVPNSDVDKEKFWLEQLRILNPRDPQTGGSK